MTVKMLQAWNGFPKDFIGTVISPAEEARLVSIGFASFDLDGTDGDDSKYSVSARFNPGTAQFELSAKGQPIALGGASLTSAGIYQNDSRNIDLFSNASRIAERSRVARFPYQAAGISLYDTYGQTSSKVSGVTLGATVFADGLVKNVFDAGAVDVIRMYGGVYGSGFAGQPTYIVSNASGYPLANNPTGPGTTSENLRGLHVRCRFRAKAFQIKAKGFGLSSNYFPMWLDDGGGFKRINFTAGAVATDSYIQVDLTTYGEYEVLIGFEQSLSIGAVVLDADGEFVSVEKASPIVVFGDSYAQGTTSPAAIGDPCLVGAMSMISGYNCIPIGVTDTGYVAGGGNAYPITHPERLALLSNVTRDSGASVAMSVFGVNDVGQSSAAVQAAATTLINHFLNNTSANLLLTGAQPRNLNNSAAIQLVDAGISSAVAEANSLRVAFAPIGGANPRAIIGARDTDTATGAAGNSRWITGNDGIHLAPSFTQAGTEFYARYMLDLLRMTSAMRRW